jgi:uncharacterized protein YyaL (SSP411 family)
MRNRSSLLPLALAASVFCAPTPARGQEEPVYWFGDYKEAVKEARRTGKPIFLEYRCEP